MGIQSHGALLEIGRGVIATWWPRESSGVFIFLRNRVCWYALDAVWEAEAGAHQPKELSLGSALLPWKPRRSWWLPEFPSDRNSHRRSLNRFKTGPALPPPNKLLVQRQRCRW